jgi:YaiO family outer membrane protein
VFLNGALRAQIEAGVTPDADFLPAWRLAPGASLRLGTSTSLLLEGSLRDYATGTVKGANVGLEQYFLNGAVSLNARFVNSWDPAGRHLTGWRVGGSFVPVRRVALHVLYADAPESDSGIVAGTRAWGTGLSFEVTPSLILRVDYARENRQGSYIREDLTGTFSILF